MHPELASAMAHAREQDLRRSTRPHGRSNFRVLARPVRGRRPLLPRPHLPLGSHRIRLGQ
jgi:hypothetical protein